MAPNRKIFLIDFGIAFHANGHSMLRQAADITYASYNQSVCQFPVPLDDWESLGYSLVVLATGKRLPWANLGNDTDILQAKQHEKSSTLCKQLPPLFAEFLEYSRDEANRAKRLKYSYWQRRFQESIALFTDNNNNNNKQQLLNLGKEG